jgi:hypothetical protein
VSSVAENLEVRHVEVNAILRNCRLVSNFVPIAVAHTDDEGGDRRTAELETKQVSWGTTVVCDLGVHICHLVDDLPEVQVGVSWHGIHHILQAPLR